MGAYGNFVNCNLAFAEKYFGSIVPQGNLEEEIQQSLEEIYQSVGRKIEKANLRDALDEIFELVRFGNRYFDANKPWNTRTDDIAACKQTIFNCLQLIANLSVLLSPFLPFSSEKVQGWLGLDAHWGVQYVESGYLLPKPEILFERLDKGIVEKEVAILGKLGNS